eukprot:1161312-Pelagomonas_calceolata.AAC.5
MQTVARGEGIHAPDMHVQGYLGFYSEYAFGQLKKVVHNRASKSRSMTCSKLWYAGNKKDHAGAWIHPALPALQPSAIAPPPHAHCVLAKLEGNCEYMLCPSTCQGCGEGRGLLTHRQRCR